MTTTTAVPAARQTKTGAVQAFVNPRQPNGQELLPWLPCTLALEIPVVNFTVGYLLELKEGALVCTSTHQSSDIPLLVNGVLMAWTEFEVVGDRLAARITDLV